MMIIINKLKKLLELGFLCLIIVEISYMLEWICASLLFT